RVAIPRLKRSEDGRDAYKARQRVSRACAHCQSQKTKCTGDRPRCKRCETTDHECVYIMLKKDRLKIATDVCQQMATLLMRMRAYATAEDNTEIGKALEAMKDIYSPVRNESIPEIHTSLESEARPPEASIVVSDPDGSRNVSDNINEASHRYIVCGSDRVASLNENLHANNSASATGYIGMSSEVRWLRSIAENRSQQAGNRRESFPHLERHEPLESRARLLSYWTDSAGVSRIDTNINPHELPPPGLAKKLLSCYLLKVQDSFPILPRTTFESQFRLYFEALHHGNPPRLAPLWQAKLNLVFAIGAQYLVLAHAGQYADKCDPLVFYARADALLPGGIEQTGSADVPRIQYLGLLSFYHLCTGQVSRAWNIIGTALRLACSLGLHLRNEDRSASQAKQEALSRVWWSLYSLEHLLSTVTGRPSMVEDMYCSVSVIGPVAGAYTPSGTEDMFWIGKPSTSPFPVNADLVSNSGRTQYAVTNLGFVESGSATAFAASVQLSIITQAILSSLYPAVDPARSGDEMQQVMTRFERRLDQWIESLPNRLNFEQLTDVLDTDRDRERVLLGFQLSSARILLGQQCFHAYIWRQTLPMHYEARFACKISSICLNAAKAIINFLPDEPCADFIYNQCPWWCFVHHLMQAVSIFLLGLSDLCISPEDGMSLQSYVNKTIGWLQVMDNAVAHRADQTVRHLLSLEVTGT
ncbi:C6 transcription factor-like protein, partial [Boeremia exigua]|uniref:C6 transcription factor-like protein n=1 Tax=Boeremia exigua TaxID=749465 RepID=UPI001E8ED206